MKKPFRGDGLAFSELIYSTPNKVATPSQKDKCSCKKRRHPERIAARDGRNMANATRSIQGDSNTSQKVFEELSSRYCPYCQKIFKKAYWEEMEKINE